MQEGCESNDDVQEADKQLKRCPGGEEGGQGRAAMGLTSKAMTSLNCSSSEANLTMTPTKMPSRSATPASPSQRILYLARVCPATMATNSRIIWEATSFREQGKGQRGSSCAGISPE